MTSAPAAAAAPPSTDPDAIRLDDLRRTHTSPAGTVVALDGVSATFPRGTFTAVMGPSGSGKSTLLHCAAGLDVPTAGRVVVDGVDLAGLGEKGRAALRRERVGVVFQAFNLVSSLTAAQNVELPTRLAGRRVTADETTAALARVGLADRAGHRPAELSGGQQQRVAIARALLTRPAVVLADEPTGALDSRSSREVLRLLRELVDREGRTVVMVTHDPLAAGWADVALLLADGRVVERLPLVPGHPSTPGMIAARTAALGAATGGDGR